MRKTLTSGERGSGIMFQRPSMMMSFIVILFKLEKAEPFSTKVHPMGVVVEVDRTGTLQ